MIHQDQLILAAGDNRHTLANYELMLIMDALHRFDDNVLQRHFRDALLVVGLQWSNTRHNTHDAQSVILVEPALHISLHRSLAVEKCQRI